MNAKSRSKSKSSPAKAKRKKPATAHNAAVDAFKHIFREYLKSKVIQLKEEHRLSKEPLRIDIVIIRKIRDVPIETNIGRIFRGHNVIEYKSAANPPLTINDFVKTVHGYVGIYSDQKRVKLTDMTATIVCYNHPTKLFETLKEEFNYKILRGSEGIYYISLKGSVPEKSLLIQIVVSSELPDSEIVLKDLREGVDGATARKVWDYINSDEGQELLRSYWGEYFVLKNSETLYEEVSMTDLERALKPLVKKGLFAKDFQKARREGEARAEARGVYKVFTLLDMGYSPAEAKKKLQLA